MQKQENATQEKWIYCISKLYQNVLSHKLLKHIPNLTNYWTLTVSSTLTVFGLAVSVLFFGKELAERSALQEDWVNVLGCVFGILFWEEQRQRCKMIFQSKGFYRIGTAISNCQTSAFKLFLPILCPLKTPAKLYFSSAFRPYKIGTLARNVLTLIQS